MKLDKAIRTLTDILNFVKPGDPPAEHDAIKLGIEALKRLEGHRQGICIASNTPLPGETSTNTPTLSKDQIKKLRESPIGEK